MGCIVVQFKGDGADPVAIFNLDPDHVLAGAGRDRTNSGFDGQGVKRCDQDKKETYK
jgi:hypothetical protein